MVHVKLLQKQSAAPVPPVVQSDGANLNTTMKAVRPESSTTANNTPRSKVTATAVNVTAPSK